MTTFEALFAEVKRDLISERTREGLARAKASGRKRGRQKVRRFLEMEPSKTAIAMLTDVSRTARYSFMKTRGLRTGRPGR